MAKKFSSLPKVFIFRKLRVLTFLFLLKVSQTSDLSSFNQGSVKLDPIPRTFTIQKEANGDQLRSPLDPATTRGGSNDDMFESSRERAGEIDADIIISASSENNSPERREKSKKTTGNPFNFLAISSSSIIGNINMVEPLSGRDFDF